MPKIDMFFKYMIENSASDLHLSVGSKPRIRKHGVLEEINYQELTNEALKALLFEIIDEQKQRKFIERNDLDFA